MMDILIHISTYTKEDILELATLISSNYKKLAKHEYCLSLCLNEQCFSTCLAKFNGFSAKCRLQCHHFSCRVFFHLPSHTIPLIADFSFSFLTVDSSSFTHYLFSHYLLVNTQRKENPNDDSSSSYYHLLSSLFI